MSPGRWETALQAAVERYDPVGGGGRVHSLHWPGSGPPVVLVHGMVVAGRSMIGAAGVLADRGIDVHVPDLPGFGLSDRPAVALAVDGLADGLAGWARARGLDGCTLVGNSFGTQVAAAAAARHREVVGRLGLIAPTIDPKWRRRVPGRMLAGAGGTDRSGEVGTVARRGAGRRLVTEMLASPWIPPGRPSMRRLIASEYAVAGPGRVLSTYRHAIADRIEERLPLIRGPVLVARGSEDALVTEDWARSLAALAPWGRFMAVPGATHDAEYDRPDLFAGTILSLLDDGADGQPGGRTDGPAGSQSSTVTP